MDFSEIEAKWQKEWSNAKLFEGSISEKPSYFVFGAFPYVNAPAHIGHFRAFGTADVLARYKRMKGFNVLFPMGFHATGTPVLSFAKRIRNHDADIIEDYKAFGISDEELKKMEDPKYIAEYFARETEKDFIRIGLSIDWTRKFISVEPFFSKFVEWQFSILDSKKYFVKGKHPVGWCTNENNAVGMHDTKHDVEPDIEKEVAIKFGVVGENASVLCVTYRPETIYGVTNIFVKDNANYALCKVGGEMLYMAKASAEKLKHQLGIEIVKEVSSRELLGKKCTNPVTAEVVPVLPGFFVKEDVGSGIVMSVPAHAPFDYAALERLRVENYPMPELHIKKIIEVEIGRSLSDVSVGEAKPVHLDIPALAYLEVLHTDVNAIEDMIEFATKLEYREESHWGKMTVKGMEGMSEPEAREKVKNEMIAAGKAFEVYVLTNAPVICRCGTDVVVKVVDQWFLNYGNEDWKKQAKEAFASMSILPESARNGFAAAIDWIDMRAVARAQGLGTRFPLDKDYIIESLSDSTIYMAFYTIVPLIRNVEVEKLRPEFFDFVFLGKGDADAISKSTGIDYEIVKKCRESFEYWYVETSSHSGGDLVFNHLTMSIFNHVAVFEKKHWLKQIAVNGMVLSEGEKMSKSLGNTLPLRETIEKHGVDPTRLVIIGGVDVGSDSEFSISAVNGVKERFEYIAGVIAGLDGLKSGELKGIDYWLYSRLNSKIELATQSIEKLSLRDTTTAVLYDSVIELKRYFERGGNNSIVVRDFLQGIVLMLQPLAPHVAEEFWHALGNQGFASVEKWPETDSELLNKKIEKSEEAIDALMLDAKNAAALLSKKNGKPARSMKLVIAAEWKREAYNMFAETKDYKKVLDWLRENNKSNPEAAAKYVAKISKMAGEIRKIETSEDEEYKLLQEASAYIAGKLGIERVEVEREEQSRSSRAERAMPLKPSIELGF